jgi:hypothetical protein
MFLSLLRKSLLEIRLEEEEEEERILFKALLEEPSRIWGEGRKREPRHV